MNLIVPLARRAHWEVASEADVVVTHWEASPRRRTPKTWIHTVGTADEALAAVAAGADAVIAQGVEAGGHVRGTVPALELLDQVLRVVGSRVPVIVAGGIATPRTCRPRSRPALRPPWPARRSWPPMRAAPTTGYKQRLVESDETVLTELFGHGLAARAPSRPAQRGDSSLADGRPARTGRGARFARRAEPVVAA